MIDESTDTNPKYITKSGLPAFYEFTTKNKIHAWYRDRDSIIRLHWSEDRKTVILKSTNRDCFWNDKVFKDSEEHGVVKWCVWVDKVEVSLMWKDTISFMTGLGQMEQLDFQPMTCMTELTV